jgi:hypothetical protein
VDVCICLTRSTFASFYRCAEFDSKLLFIDTCSSIWKLYKVAGKAEKRIERRSGIRLIFDSDTFLELDENFNSPFEAFLRARISAVYGRCLNLNSKQNVHVVLQGLAILLFIFFVGAAVVVLVFPMEQRLFAPIMVSTLAAVSCGLFVVRKLAKDIKERIMGLSVFSTVPSFLLITYYLFFILKKG